MRTIITILIVLCTAAVVLSAEQYEGVRIFMEQPDVPYVELGLIAAKVPADDTGYNIARNLESILKDETRRLGGNAFIVKRISRKPFVYKKHVDYEKNPFLFVEHLSISVLMDATAIKLAQ